MTSSNNDRNPTGDWVPEEHERGRQSFTDRFRRLPRGSHVERDQEWDPPTVGSSKPEPPEGEHSLPQWNSDIDNVTPPAASEPPTIGEHSGDQVEDDDSSVTHRLEAPAPSAIEAFRQGALLQRAWLNLGEMIGTKYVFEQTLDYHAPIEPEYLAVVREVFARPNPPLAFDQALGKLSQPGSVLVLNRPADTGRTIMAYALMGSLLEQGHIKEVRPIPFGGSQHFPARRLPHENDRGYVLELPPDEDGFAIAASFGASLRSIISVLERRRSRLIVLTTPAQWRRVSLGAPDGVAPQLGEPTPRDIAARWLYAQEPDFPVNRWLDDSKIISLLQKQSPTEVLRLVDLILEEHRTAQPSDSSSSLDGLHDRRVLETKSVDQQIDDVVAARSDWEDELHEWHEKKGPRTGFQRSFLLAAAVLREHSVAHIYAKAADLTSELGGQPVDTTGHEAPGVIAMTRAIEARRTESDTLVFERPYWDDAALEYFWNDRPLARRAFLKWLAQVPVDNGTSKNALETLSREDRRVLAERVGEFAVRWAVRHLRQEPLQEIISAWYNDKKDLWPMAVRLLDAAAGHPASAPYVHTMLLNWAGRKDPALQLAVVDVCRGQFGRWNTGKALRRLRHIAALGHPDVIDSLQETVRTLYDDTTARSTLFGYVIDWCRNENTSSTVGLRTFAALATSSRAVADGVPLLLDRSVSDDDEVGEATFQPSTSDLVIGWRTLLSAGPGRIGERELDTAIFMWLDTALARPDLRSQILATLRQAAGILGDEGPKLREALRTTASAWVQGPDRDYDAARENVRDELARSLDADLVQRRHSEAGKAVDGDAA